MPITIKFNDLSPERQQAVTDIVAHWVNKNVEMREMADGTCIFRLKADAPKLDAQLNLAPEMEPYNRRGPAT